MGLVFLVRLPLPLGEGWGEGLVHSLNLRFLVPVPFAIFSDALYRR